MQLTRHTDYALRLLIHLAGSGGARFQIADVAEAQAISRTHLMKIANELARGGVIEAMRGRGGGIWLARDPADIRLGDVVRAMEPRHSMVDCTSCRLVDGCGLPFVLHKASAAFHEVLDRFTLADILDKRKPAKPGKAVNPPPVTPALPAA
ncbi:MAG: Rrf2 family transcriptional regulator [Novosphingobium sp.]|nr:Rrf2 family transcriptional regulator [Novosphingobium sp.]